MSATILLAGATGNVGGEVLRQLSAAGHAVRAMVRNPSKAADLAGPKVELVQADFDRPESLEAALAGADKAFVATPVDARHVEWMKAFYLGAKHANVRHVVKLSGMGAADDSPSQIIRMHAETDRLLRGSGLGYTILQPNAFYQNLLGMAATIRAQGAFYIPMGEARQSLIDIRDIAAAAVRCLTTAGHEGKTYELTGPAALTYSDVAQKLAAAIGKSVKYVPVPVDAAREGMRSAGMPEWNAGAVAEIFSAFATGRYASVTDAVERVTGRAPIPFDQFARDFATAFR